MSREEKVNAYVERMLRDLTPRFFLTWKDTLYVVSATYSKRSTYGWEHPDYPLGKLGAGVDCTYRIRKHGV